MSRAIDGNIGLDRPEAKGKPLIEENLQRRDSALMEYAAFTLTLVDISYFVLLYLTSSNPWATVGLAVLFPAINVPALKLTEKTGIPFINYSLSLSLITMFLVAMVSGPGSPGWVLCFSGVIASHLMVQNLLLKRILIPSFVLLALLGSYVGGASVLELGVAMVVLTAFTMILTRIFGFMTLQYHKLDEEVVERRRAEENLERNQILLSGVIENSDALIYAKDSEGRYILVNERWEKLTQTPRQEALNKDDFSFFSKEVAEDFRANDAMVAARGTPYTTEELVETPEGNITFLSSKFPLISNEGEALGICGISTDINERKVAEQKLADAYDVISSSIAYASRIQSSVLPDHALMHRHLSDHFVLWKPRDVVGGDIYWIVEWGDGLLITLIDCTGHGVPGAFMTLIATGALERALPEVPVGDPSALVQRTHQLVQTTLSQEVAIGHASSGNSDDGLELGMCYVPADKKSIHFVGAKFDLFVVRGGEVSSVRGTKSGLGYRAVAYDQSYGCSRVPVDSDASYFMTTDGLIDQIGGPKARSFGKSRFRKLLVESEGHPMTERGDKIHHALVEFQGEQKRRDDVALIGFKV